MAIIPHYAIQKAVYEALTGDAGLMAIVTGVHDEVPQNPVFPIVVFGRFTITNWSTMTSTGAQSVITMHAYSKTSKLQVLDILDRIYEVLQQGNLNLENQALVAMRFDYHDAGGLSPTNVFQGLIRFRVYTEYLPA
jgi:hypothetical protein